jgi:hypothetical protein
MIKGAAAGNRKGERQILKDRTARGQLEGPRCPSRGNIQDQRKKTLLVKVI